ncbi:MAG TPA: hypothetical protein VFC85_02510 [Verrucomicrobiae bacterium]|nr:hypothetical protein [Verrucomicrobiae bacterium]
MIPAHINCPQCQKPSLVLWCFQEKAFYDHCLLSLSNPQSISEYQLLFIPRRDESNKWVQLQNPDFGFLRKFVDAFLRPAKNPQLKPFLTKTPRSIIFLLKMMESITPKIPDPNDPILAPRLEMITQKAHQISEEIKKERLMISLISNPDKRANYTRKIKELERNLDTLEEEKDKLLTGDDPDLTRIRAIKRLKKDFELWDKGLLEIELSTKVHHVYWQLLKPTGDSWQELIEHFRYLENSIGKKYDQNRLKYLYDFKHDEIYVGRSAFEGYVVICFNRAETVVLECPRVGNALYLMKLDEWKFLSQHSKSELLSKYPEKIEHILHSESYEYEVERRFRNRGIN